MIKVDVKNVIKNTPNFWNHICFHPTDAIEDNWGKFILDEISNEKVAKFVRIYSMFEDIFTMNEKGEIISDFSLNDQRIKYLLSKGFKPLISCAFLPPFLASVPNSTSVVAKSKTRYKGKTINVSLPKDYKIWEEICYLYFKHVVDTFGIDEVLTWKFQCWNEPDCHLFFMPELLYEDNDMVIKGKEYFKLYNSFVNGALRVNKNIKCGGPCLAYPIDSKPPIFLETFLELVKTNNIKFDFFSYHIYGTDPNKLKSGDSKLNVKSIIEKHIKIANSVKKFFPDIEMILDEWGASAWGFCNIDDCKELIFRETNVFAVYYGKLIIEFIKRNLNVSKMMICLSGQHELTTEFSGFRGFFTKNFVRKPIFNAYALASKLHNNIIHVSNENGLAVLATKDDLENISILICYSDDNFEKELSDLELDFSFLNTNSKYNLELYTIDKNHLNPYEQYKNNPSNYEYSNEEVSKMKDLSKIMPLKKLENIGIKELKISISCDSFTLIKLKKIDNK